MKVVILTDDFPPKSLGGAGIVAYMQAKELLNRGHEVSIVTTFQDEGIEEKINLNGLIVYRIQTNYNMFFRAYISLFNPKVVFKVKKILKEIKPDVIHVHNIHQFLSYKVLDYAKLYSKRVVITFHDVMSVHYTKLYPKKVEKKENVFDYKVTWFEQIRAFGLQYNPFRNICIKHYLRNADCFLAVSGSLKTALEQNGLKNLQVLHNGVDLKDFEYNTERVESFKNKYDLNNKKILFFSGRISRAKGIDVCFNLIKEISKTIPEIRLLIAGQKNAYVEDILKRNDMQEVASKVVFTGWLDREEVVSAYYSSDLIPVLSLYLDPLPTTNLEAMTARKPVLGTIFGGTSEIIIDGQTGFLVNPNDSKLVFEKTLTILNNKDLAVKFGEAGYKRLMNNFQIKQQIDVLEKFYGVNK